MAKPSWDKLRPITQDEIKPLASKARKAADRIPVDARNDLIAFLMQTRVIRTAPEGASDSALRDIEAGRRVALSLINVLNGSIHDDGNSDRNAGE